MTKKYILTDTTIEHKGRTLYQIQALIDIPYYNVSKGDLGGYVESENNLSHQGNAWVARNAKVYDHAFVYDSAFVGGDAQVHGYARVWDNAQVYNNAEVHGDATVYGNASIRGGAEITNFARVFEKAFITDSAVISGNSSVFGGARVLRNTRIADEAEVSGNVVLGDDILVGANASIKGHVQIKSHRHFIIDGAVITDENQIFYTKDLTVYKGQDGLMVFLNLWNYPKHEEFRGPIDKFLAYSKENHDPKTYLEYVLLIDVARSRIGDQANDQ